MPVGVSLSDEDFNPPSPCGEGRLGAWDVEHHIEISIHPPRVGRDTTVSALSQWQVTFQSTLPVWGGTLSCTPDTAVDIYFNPPSPCGEGLRLSPT